jgi:hypothetical protein
MESEFDPSVPKEELEKALKTHCDTTRKQLEQAGINPQPPRSMSEEKCPNCSSKVIERDDKIIKFECTSFISYGFKEKFFESMRCTIATLRSENTTLQKRVEELEGAMTESLKLCTCHGTGKRRTHCTQCGDSSWDHECDDKEVDCERCAPLRRAAALANKGE